MTAIVTLPVDLERVYQVREDGPPTILKGWATVYVVNEIDGEPVVTVVIVRGESLTLTASKRPKLLTFDDPASLRDKETAK